MTEFEVRSPDSAFYRRFVAWDRIEAAALVAVMSIKESKELLTVWEGDEKESFFNVQEGVPFPYRNDVMGR